MPAIGQFCAQSAKYGSTFGSLASFTLLVFQVNVEMRHTEAYSSDQIVDVNFWGAFRPRGWKSSSAPSAYNGATCFCASYDGVLRDPQQTMGQNISPLGTMGSLRQSAAGRRGHGIDERILAQCNDTAAHEHRTQRHNVLRLHH